LFTCYTFIIPKFFKMSNVFSHFFPTSLLFISMGRKKKYTTEQQLSDANKEKYMRYYHNNIIERRKKALERYYIKKGKK